MAKDDPKTVTIDGKTYKWEDLSQTVKRSIMELQRTDETIRRLRHELILAQTAQRVFATAVKQGLS